MHTPFSESEINYPTNKKYKDRCADTFHNLVFDFPAGSTPYQPKKSNWVTQAWHREILHKLGYWDNQDIVKWDRNREIKITYSEYYKEVDKTVLELGITPADISVAVNPLYAHKSREMTDEDWKKVWDILYPVYAVLRKKGFSKKTLRG